MSYELFSMPQNYHNSSIPATLLILYTSIRTSHCISELIQGYTCTETSCLQPRFPELGPQVLRLLACDFSLLPIALHPFQFITEYHHVQLSVNPLDNSQAFIATGCSRCFVHLSQFGFHLLKKMKPSVFFSSLLFNFICPLLK